MARSGFRWPQFSEESAWLPPWLQHPQLEPSIDSVAKDLFVKGNIDVGRCVDNFSGGGGRFSSCHLFLSSDGNSQRSFSPSPWDVLHLRLHLSSDGNSLHDQSQFSDTPQVVPCSNEVLALQQSSLASAANICNSEVDHTCGPEKIICQSKMDLNGVELSPQTTSGRGMENSNTQSAMDNKDSWKLSAERYHNTAKKLNLPAISCSTMLENVSSPANCKETEKNIKGKVEFRQTKDADVDNAVELAIAASEVLAINELSRSVSLSGLTTANVLEAALRVKQARLDTLEDIFHCQSDELDGMDSLSELDDTVMLDAFLDVGLSLIGSDEHVCASYSSVVKDIPEPENRSLLESGSEVFPLMAQHDKACDDVSLGFNISHVSCSVEPSMHQISVEMPHCPAVGQLEDCAHASILANYSGEDKLDCGGANKFQSRWLGGWTTKEADASTKPKQKIAKSVPQLFVGETSSLSESADIAPDENSFVQNHEREQKVASQSSIPFEGVCDKADGEILISQEIRSCNLSLLDPLCSVVPCSISSENAMPVHNQFGFNGENCFPMPKNGMENIRAPDLSSKSAFLDAKDMYSAGNSGGFSDCPICPESTFMDAKATPSNGNAGGFSEAPVRRHLSSLRTYSTLVTNHGIIVDDRRLCSRSCIRFSDWRACDGFLPSAEFKCSVVKDAEKLQEAKVIGFPVAQITIQDSIYASAKEGAEMQDHTSIPFQNPDTCSHMQASKLSMGTIIRDTNHEQGVAKETQIVLCDRNNLPKTKLKPKNPSTVENLTRKRVHFSEHELTLQQNNDLQDPPASLRKCSFIRASERSKRSYPPAESQSNVWTSCFTSPRKDDKRLIFHGAEFLLTGFSSHKERAIMRSIQEHGGIVLSDIPSPSCSGANKLMRSNCQQLPIVISSKKVQTVKFLYGCAVNSLILKLKWVTNSIAAGSMLPPEKYMILSHQVGLKCMRSKKLLYYDDRKRIFDKVGILLHGKHRFYTKLATIIKHGGGQVFKTLQRLFHSLDAKKISVGAIVFEDHSRALRHLKHCASERKIPTMPASWIAKSLHLGKLLPFRENETASLPKKTAEVVIYPDWSQEI